MGWGVGGGGGQVPLYSQVFADTVEVGLRVFPWHLDGAAKLLSKSFCLAWLASWSSGCRGKTFLGTFVSVYLCFWIASFSSIHSGIYEGKKIPGNSLLCHSSDAKVLHQSVSFSPPFREHSYISFIDNVQSFYLYLVRGIERNVSTSFQSGASSQWAYF